MLQPSSIASLLAQLINTDSNTKTAGPHTAILSLVDTSELYAVASRLSESTTPETRSTVATVLAETAVASGSSNPNPASRRLSTLSLDERATCLSAIAVSAWRQAVGFKAPSTAERGASFIAIPGTKVTISASQHSVAPIAPASGSKSSQDLVPLLLECELGKLLVMPIVPSVPQMSSSRAELATGDYSQDDSAPMYLDSQKPYMLLTLNAELMPAASSAPKSPSGLTSSTSTLTATQVARSRLRSGGNTPTSLSDTTATPSRSPMSESFPGADSSEGLLVKATDNSAEDALAKVWDEAVWSELFGQAKAFARMMAPSLAKCGVGVSHDDDHLSDERRSGNISEDDVDDS